MTWTRRPGVSVLGKPQVWVAFRFTSDAAGHTSPGPFVDDVLIRKCPDTLCSPLSRGRAGAGSDAGHQDVANRTMTRVALQGSCVMRYSTPICPDSAS